ncbi:MAG: sugar ABC transporter permease, partial [Clostridiales bacterium]|nr:sugar ABC transporter permease [Clostridiales bacterium]
FHYFPMYGILMAFKNFSPRLGIWNSKWVGLTHFQGFFNNPLSGRLMTNTLLLGIYSLLWSFPAPIILALLFNELRALRYKKLVQTVSYFPYFISVVVVCGMLREMTSREGLFNQITALFGREPKMFLLEPKYFRTIFIASGIWQGVGFGSIIYLAALSGVDPELYDVADIDGAGRFMKMIHISWQAIKPTTIVLLIFNLGGILGTDFQKVLLLYTPDTYSVADVIGTYVYREGLLGGRYESATAIGLFMSAISFVILVLANAISRRLSETSLW